jgi:hypothetical protein
MQHFTQPYWHSVGDDCVRLEITAPWRGDVLTRSRQWLGRRQADGAASSAPRLLQPPPDPQPMASPIAADANGMPSDGTATPAVLHATHHEIFARHKPWSGTCPDEFIPTFSGSLIRREFYMEKCDGFTSGWIRMICRT